MVDSSSPLSTGIVEARERLIQLRASTLPGALHAIAVALPDRAREQADELGAVLEAGWPEFVRELEAVITLLGGESDQALAAKRFARGWQTVLLRSERRTGRREPAAWREDPETWMAGQLMEAGA